MAHGTAHHGDMEGVEDLPLAAAFERGLAAYTKLQSGALDEVRVRPRPARAVGRPQIAGAVPAPSSPRSIPSLL